MHFRLLYRSAAAAFTLWRYFSLYTGLGLMAGSRSTSLLAEERERIKGGDGVRREREESGIVKSRINLFIRHIFPPSFEHSTRTSCSLYSRPLLFSSSSTPCVLLTRCFLQSFLFYVQPYIFFLSSSTSFYILQNNAINRSSLGDE